MAVTLLSRSHGVIHTNTAPPAGREPPALRAFAHRPAGTRQNGIYRKNDTQLAPGLIHHSDRGSQYASHAFQARLKEYGMVRSMSRKGNCWDNAPTESYKVSLKARKRIEEAFGWIKTVGGLAKTRLIGHARLAGQALMCFAAYNLVRMGSIGGWWDAHHV